MPPVNSFNLSGLLPLCPRALCFEPLVKGQPENPALCALVFLHICLSLTCSSFTVHYWGFQHFCNLPGLSCLRTSGQGTFYNTLQIHWFCGSHIPVYLFLTHFAGSAVAITPDFSSISVLGYLIW